MPSDDACAPRGPRSSRRSSCSRPAAARCARRLAGAGATPSPRRPREASGASRCSDLDARPRLTLVSRDGDPAPALVVSVATDLGSVATTALASVVEARLLAAGFDVDARIDRSAFRVRLLVRDATRVAPFLRAVGGVRAAHRGRQPRRPPGRGADAGAPIEARSTRRSSRRSRRAPASWGSRARSPWSTWRRPRARRSSRGGAPRRCTPGAPRSPPSAPPRSARRRRARRRASTRGRRAARPRIPGRRRTRSACTRRTSSGGGPPASPWPRASRAPRRPSPRRSGSARLGPRSARASRRSPPRFAPSRCSGWPARAAAA